MDYLSNVLKLPSWQKKQQCCCLCQADTVGENSWRNFSENAPWVATCWTPQTWHLFPQKSPCKLLNDIPGASAALVALDFMHNKYLGTDQYVFGSVMQLGFFALSFFCTFFFALSFLYFVFCTFYVLFLHFPRYLLTHQLLDIGSPLKNLEYLDQLIQQFYVDNPSPTKYRHMGKLTMFMRKKGGPKLRGKAIEIRSFGPAILSLWQQFHNPGLQIHKYILLLLKLNQQVDFVLEEYKGFFSFPANIAEDFTKTIFQMGHLQVLVESHFANEGGPHLFTTTSKLHGLAHSGLLSKYVSPRLVWCFTGEDYMHHIQVLAQSCLAGTGPYLMGNKVASKMRNALHVQFSKRSKV